MTDKQLCRLKYSIQYVCTVQYLYLLPSSHEAGFLPGTRGSIAFIQSPPV